MASTPQTSITQPLVQGVIKSITQPSSFNVPSQPFSTSLATQLGTNLGLTPNLGTNTMLGTQGKTIPKNTNWTLIFSSQPYSSTTTSSQSIHIVQTSQVIQRTQVDQQGQVNTIVQSQSYTQQGPSSSKHPIDTSNQMVPLVLQVNTSNPLVTKPLNQGNSLVPNQIHQGNASNPLVPQHQNNQGNRSNQLIQIQSMPLILQHQVEPPQPLTPQVMQNQMGPQAYIPTPQSQILQGMIAKNQGQNVQNPNLMSNPQNIITHQPPHNKLNPQITHTMVPQNPPHVPQNQNIASQYMQTSHFLPNQKIISQS